MTVILAIGTRKGLFLARTDGTPTAARASASGAGGPDWQVGPPQFLMQEVPSVAFTSWDAGSAVRLLVDLTSVNRAVGMFTADLDMSASAGSTTQRTLGIAGVPHRAV